MKTIRSIDCELKKSILSPAFLVCVITTFILCFTAVCYTSTNNEGYSIYKVMTTFSKEQILENADLNSFNIFRIGSRSWLSMFIPIVAAFPFIPVFCDERSSGNMRFTILRQGKIRYCFSKFCTSFLSGGLAVMIGYALFGIVVKIIFPSLSNFPAEQKTFYIDYYLNHGIIIAVVQHLIQMFLYGSIASLLAFAISSFIHNKYLIMCIPFMLKYIYDQTLLKLSTYAIENNNFEFVEKLNIFNTNNTLTFFHQNNNFRWILALNIGFILVCFCFFSVIMNRRFDLGA